MSALAVVPARPVPPLRRAEAVPVVLRVVLAMLAGLVAGGLTSFAQTVLPDAIASVANSSSGWTLAVVLVVAALRLRPVAAGVAGPLCFTALVLGYQVVSGLRGYPTSEWFFLAAGVLVGPFVGVATAWLRARGVRAALAAALLAGVAVGEAVYGLTAVAGSTSPVYWSLIGAAGVVLLVVTGVRSAPSWAHRALSAGVAALVAVGFLAAYGSGPVADLVSVL